jgi:hypothetical protein
MKLNAIQFYGRPAEDVLLMFGLSADLQALQGCRVLDCPGGPSSFTASLAASGIEAVACDPLYAMTNAQLRHKQADAQILLRSVGRNTVPADWLDQKHQHQRAAFEVFLADRYAHPWRYLAAALPCLPFPDDHFDLVCSGHLLFSYAPVEEGGLMVSGGFDLDWHHSALLELCRVSKSEVRIYPAHTTALIAQRHHYAQWLLEHLPLGWSGEFTSPCYFQGMIGRTDGLRLWRREQ